MKTFSAVAFATLTMVGVSSAQTKTPQPAPAPAKTPAPMPAPAPAKEPGKATMPAPAKAPEKPATPQPPAELAAMAKTMAGTWRCKGDEWDHASTKGAMTAVSTARLDLDKWWLVQSMDVKGRMPFKMVAYITYDPAGKKWRQLAVMSGGGHMIGTSEGMKEGKMMWNLDMMSPMGAGMFRDHIDMTDPKAGMKGWGEMSMDKGKTWHKVYEMTCKK